jgi:hypothetical protein
MASAWLAGLEGLKRSAEYKVLSTEEIQMQSTMGH